MHAGVYVAHVGAYVGGACCSSSASATEVIFTVDSTQVVVSWFFVGVAC